eukprot:comp12082_c0_seq1/m.6818 comp12082_c0_seq1/g.6818  ORF comp12082_c0_seq1/g.6818 comp12082_c0_seq1/m.6818 type:complete len:419 (-) comp12082_c0_seq1:362-1618(-)
MVFCHECGENCGDAKFCHACGTRLKNPEVGGEGPTIKVDKNPASVENEKRTDKDGNMQKQQSGPAAASKPTGAKNAPTSTKNSTETTVVHRVVIGQDKDTVGPSPAKKPRQETGVKAAEKTETETPQRRIVIKRTRDQHPSQPSTKPTTETGTKTSTAQTSKPENEKEKPTTAHGKSTVAPPKDPEPKLNLSPKIRRKTKMIDSDEEGSGAEAEPKVTLKRLVDESDGEEEGKNSKVLKKKRAEKEVYRPPAASTEPRVVLKGDSTDTAPEAGAKGPSKAAKYLVFTGDDDQRKVEVRVVGTADTKNTEEGGPVVKFSGEKKKNNGTSPKLPVRAKGTATSPGGALVKAAMAGAANSVKGNNAPKGKTPPAKETKQSQQDASVFARLGKKGAGGSDGETDGNRRGSVFDRIGSAKKKA